MTVQPEKTITCFDQRPTDDAMQVEAGGLVTEVPVECGLLFYQCNCYDSRDRALGRTLEHGSFSGNFVYESPADEESTLDGELGIDEVHPQVTRSRISCRKMGVSLDEDGFPTRYPRRWKTSCSGTTLDAHVDILERCVVCPPGLRVAFRPALGSADGGARLLLLARDGALRSAHARLRRLSDARS